MYKIYKRLPGGDLRFIISCNTLDDASELAQVYADHAMLGHFDYVIFPAESLTYIRHKSLSCCRAFV